MSLHVLIAGGGIGGLALAHALRRIGATCTIYERDPAPDARPQGYRIHIDAAGQAGLEECLDERLFDAYLATASRVPRRPHALFLDDQLRERGTGDPRAGEEDPERAPTSVDRMTLRQVLLSELEGSVRYGRELLWYEEREHGVLAQFADGTCATGDMLVGADGVRSAVRAQLLPHAEVYDTGVRAIIGKTPLSAIPGVRPDIVDTSFTGISGPDRVTVAMGIFDPREPERAVESPWRIDPSGAYLMWLQLARAEDFPSEERLWTDDAETLHRTALGMLDGWHPDLRRLLASADVSSVFPLSIRAVLPVDQWPTSKVTLLGDAIHAMTPIGGRGGNSALTDAALLARRLRPVVAGERPLEPAIADYEDEMREHGYAAVEHSLRMAATALGARSPYEPVAQAAP